ncbi:phosphoglycerate mutase [Ramlibacter humi]|uniref:Phosphoglycerate mutase n=1 Tax=Ramlibacter humi TaxID=2530451 RepID=A0A4Z0BLY5_9BURK|nr:phosphoglycerate mutase [Ramlibacter humi]TFY98938.1 phosphoglycerate mutase [Ramlibacter humi]
MSDGTHLLIPFAASAAPGCRETLAGLRLPHLERVLARLAPAQDAGHDETTLSMPHEMAVARECGLGGSDGLLPFAAWELAQAGSAAGGQAWAWVTPCHWRVGADHVFMHHPQELRLDAQESQALLAAMRPYFEQDGLRLEYQAPTRWRAAGPLFAQLPCASLDRVAGRVIDRWMPRGDTGKPLRRLQQEMQMLLYTHDVNEERTRGGQLPVNSFWVSGNGVLPQPAPSRPAGLLVTQVLRHPALAEDWASWAGAWRQIDETQVAPLRARLDAGEPVAVTLCGDRIARTWRSAGAGWPQRLGRWLPPRPATTWLEPL